MSNGTENISHKPLAICLNNFKYKHGASSEDDKTDDKNDLFVGRATIIDKIVNLLHQTKTTRGSYLIAGYRGVGKTSVVNRAIEKYNKSKKRVLLSKLFFLPRSIAQL